MSAARHLSTGQLAMWIPARVLADPKLTDHGDSHAYKSHEHMVAKKVEESAKGDSMNAAWRKPTHGDPTLKESIQQEGIRQPVEMFPAKKYSEVTYNQALMNGHHRVFTANELDPKMEVPVRYLDY